MELNLQYFHFCRFFPYNIPRGPDIMFSQKFFDKHKVGVITLHAKLRTGRSRTSCTRGSTSSAEVTALTRYVVLQVASAKGSRVHGLSNSSSCASGVSISALLRPPGCVLLLTGCSGPGVAVIPLMFPELHSPSKSLFRVGLSHQFECRWWPEDAGVRVSLGRLLGLPFSLALGPGELNQQV